LTGDRGPTYSLACYNLLLHRQIKDTAGNRWNGERNRNGEPLGNDAPYEAFSSAAPLMKKLDGSHYHVKLTGHEQTLIRLWLDSATPYAGTYAAYGTGQFGGWWRDNQPLREMADRWPVSCRGRSDCFRYEGRSAWRGADPVPRRVGLNPGGARSGPHAGQ